MLKNIKHIFLGCALLIAANIFGQNCWEYEEHIPINRVGGTVVISEVYFDSHYSERIETKFHHIGEYIELFNSSSEDLDLTDWKIKDHQTEFVFPSGTVINAGDFLVVTYAGRSIDNLPGSNFLFDVDKFVDLFPEAAGYEDKVVLQNNFVLHNPYATVQLYNENGFLIDQLKYTTQGPAGSPECAIYNFCGDLDNGDGGVFNGPIYVSLAAQLEAQGFPPTSTVRYFKKSVNLQDRLHYYDHEALLDPYIMEDGTPFSIPYTIVLQEPSEAINAFPPPEPAVLANFSNTRNHIYTESFDAYGELVGKSGAYFNGLGNTTVNYSWDRESNKAWGTEIKYDIEGRTALITMPAPSCDGFVSNPRFINGGFANYVSNDSDYDQLGDISASFNNFSSLKRYYSDENSNEQLQATTTRPYFRTVYDKLNPGNVIKTIGGNEIDGEWKTGFTYTVPATQEMYYVFGKDYYNGESTVLGEEVIAKNFKTVTIDAHGNENVLFTDENGRIIATAKSGGFQEYEVVSAIGEQGFVDVHIPHGVNSVSFLTPSSDYSIYDLRTGNEIPASSITGGNLYRIEALPGVAGSGTYISPSGSVAVETGTRGVRYNVNYYDYSLNYYDISGRLYETSQPLGFNSSCLSSIQNSVSHGMLTSYEYDALGFINKSVSPDEGVSNFKYRADGKIRFSQNSEQELENKVSFTDYDDQSRAVRSGVGTADFNALDPDSSDITAGLEEISETLYDIPASDLASIITSNGLNPNEYIQSFLSNNVSRTRVTPIVGQPAVITTWYNYDIYGRIIWTVQNIDGLGLKTIHYKYDNRGNIRKQIYQKDMASELFIHQYTYDKNNRLRKIETSSDGIAYKEQAIKKYYKSGPLKRTEIGNGLQGMDYVYTLSGRLKSINNPAMSFSDILGSDYNDVFGLSIDYYSGDYLRSNSPILSTPQGIDRYDGNIKATRWNTKSLSLPDQQDAYVFTYDRNVWLSEATFGSADANANIFPTDDYKVSNISYDSNGNIITLNRTKNTVLGINEMDDFTYHYNDDRNQLNHITDGDSSPMDADDLETQAPDNYDYNEIGQLTKNFGEGIIYEYNAQGLVTKMKKTTGESIVEFSYDDKGQRIGKQSFNESGDPLDKTYYVRGTGGGPIAIYRNSTLIENAIQGGSRLGIHSREDNSDIYQQSDQLGNVRALLRQAADENPIIYEEDFNDILDIEPATWLPGGHAAIALTDQKLRVTVTQNWNYTRIRFPLEAGKTYQIKFKLEMESILGQFYALARKVGGGSDWLYHSGSSIQEGGYYTYSIEPTETAEHELLFGGCRITDYPNGTDFVQPNIFYLDDFELKDTSIDVLAYTDYYPGGMPMPNRNVEENYRYGYQGEFAETDPETGKPAFQLRLYDPRINRWLSPDPKNQYASPYLSMGNNWISRVDPDGGDDNDIFYNSETGESTEVETDDNFDRVFIDGELSGKFSKGVFDLSFLNITETVKDFRTFSSSQIPYVVFEGKTIGAFGFRVRAATDVSRRGNKLFGVKAQGGFIDLHSGFNKLKFFQTIRSNDGRGKYPRIDGHPESYPYYLDTPDLGLDLGYYDFPNRPDTGDDIEWRAEFSMLNIHNDGTIQRIFTYGYGLQITPSQNDFGQLGNHGFIESPSKYHLDSIKTLKVD